MEDERQRRIGRNQALFREVNERIERVSGALRTGTDTITVLCECGNQACAERIEVSLSDYERVRAEPTLFLVRPGHATLPGACPMSATPARGTGRSREHRGIGWWASRRRSTPVLAD